MSEPNSADFALVKIHTSTVVGFLVMLLCQAMNLNQPHCRWRYRSSRLTAEGSANASAQLWSL